MFREGKLYEVQVLKSFVLGHNGHDVSIDYFVFHFAPNENNDNNDKNKT